MKLRFYSNETMLYKGFGMGALWKLLRQWREIASLDGHEITIGPGDRQEEIDKYRQKYISVDDHPIPDRHRTILEVNDRLVYFDEQDSSNIGAQLHKVPNLFDLCVKMQYRDDDACYDNIPFKVVPFTYFTPNDNMQLYEFRKIRRKIMKERSFKYSILWAGMTANTGMKGRKAISQFLAEQTKKSLHGRWTQEEYYRNICYSTVGVSSKGIGEFCHRDIEFMAIGTPFFRKTLKNRTHNPLLPNIHYYTIGGDDVGIDKTLRHFADYFEPNGELKEFTNEEWDKYCEVTNNGMKWYDENAAPKSSLRLLISILEENNII